MLDGNNPFHCIAIVAVMDAAKAQNQIHEFISKLQSPITEFQNLLCLLSAPLHTLGLLPPRYHQLPSGTSSVQKSSSLNFVPRKHLPQIQRVLLTIILPTWYPILQENDALQLVEQYFCPDAIYNTRPISGEIALLAYASLVSSTSLTKQALDLLQKLVVQYPVDRLFHAVFDGENDNTVRRSVRWEDCVRDLCAIPAKVANVFGGQVPKSLENAVYFNALSVRTEILIFSLPVNSPGLWRRIFSILSSSFSAQKFRLPSVISSINLSILASSPRVRPLPDPRHPFSFLQDQTFVCIFLRSQRKYPMVTSGLPSSSASRH